MPLDRNDARERHHGRRFIARWAGSHPVSSVAEIQAAALTRFAPDANFVRRFRPMAIGCNVETTRELVREELHVLHTTRGGRFMLQDDCWAHLVMTSWVSRT